MYEAKFKQHAGGVGRNIAEALSKLGCRPAFISVVGNDNYGHDICSALPEGCTKYIYKLSGHNTAQCNVIFDKGGECKILIGDMKIHQEITPKMIVNHKEDIKRSPLLVLDGNLSLETLETVLKLASKYSVPVFFEPTDVPICSKPFSTNYWKIIKYITPNLIELKHIAKTLKIPFLQAPENPVEEAAHIGKLLIDVIPNLIITLGKYGVVVVRRASSTDPLLDYKIQTSSKVQGRHYPTKQIETFKNVSGAGDCFASGIIAAMLSGLSEEKCLNVGFASATRSMFSDSAVPEILFEPNHPLWNSVAQYKTLY
ncbi:hypothetical protein FQA39_LY06676 [Lamprigera yunnana]|nr:hypothetical protein FQA39_LY06676 [Lamprigera yunnana]